MCFGFEVGDQREMKENNAGFQWILSRNWLELVISVKWAKWRRRRIQVRIGVAIG